MTLRFLSIYNVGIRLSALAGRFALSIYLARYFDLSVLGVYGLLQGVANGLPPAIGLGLNYYLNRETVGMSPREAGPHIRDRLLVTGTGLFLSVVLTTAYVAFCDPSYIALLVEAAPIVILEAFFFDIQLSLFSLRRPLLANSLLFVRTAAWVVPFMAISFKIIPLRNTSFLLLSWFAGQLLSGIILVWQLRDWPWRQIYRTPVDVRWLRERVNKARKIYMGDIGLAGYGYIDRFIVAGFAGLEATGVYVFLLSMATALQTLITSGIIQISLPHLVEFYKVGGSASWREMLKSLTIKVVTASFAGSLILFALVVILLPFLHRRGLSDHIGLYAAMLIGAIIKLTSDLMNYGLYSRHQDDALAGLNIAGLAILVSATVLALNIGGLSGMAYSLILIPSTMLTLRLAFLFPSRVPFGRRWLERFGPPSAVAGSA